MNFLKLRGGRPVEESNVAGNQHEGGLLGDGMQPATHPAARRLTTRQASHLEANLGADKIVARLAGWRQAPCVRLLDDTLWPSANHAIVKFRRWLALPLGALWFPL